MKKMIIAIVLICLVIAIYACGKDTGLYYSDNMPIEDAGDHSASSLLNHAPDEEYDTPPGHTLMWNGFELTQEDYHGRSEEVKVPENVLTRGDKTLTVFYSSSSGSDAAEYGLMEIIQVKIDGNWYSIPVNLSQRAAALILEPFVLDPQHSFDPYSDEARTEYTIDFSILGELPPGQYRFVERFFNERLLYEYHVLSYFWIIEPGDERPPESETSGSARLEDITFRVEPAVELRRVITDKDSVVLMLIENLSGKDYIAEEATLEMWENGQWTNTLKTNSNLGLMQRWQRRSSSLYLDEPLLAGAYRIRLSMNVFGTSSFIEPVYEFTVIPFDDAPKPVWDPSRLRVSGYNAIRQSDGVRLVLANSVLNDRNTILEFTVIADANYSFGEYYTVEVFLDGDWYIIPFANGDFNSIGYSAIPGINRSYSCYPVFSYGILPAGKYRIIKEFDFLGSGVFSEENWESPPTYLGKEFAFAEFTVEETLDSLMMQ